MPREPLHNKSVMAALAVINRTEDPIALLQIADEARAYHRPYLLKFLALRVRDLRRKSVGSIGRNSYDCLHEEIKEMCKDFQKSEEAIALSKAVRVIRIRKK